MGIGVVPLMSNETEVAVLFADVVGSTRLYEVLGDRQARDTIMVCVEVMRGGGPQDLIDLTAAQVAAMLRLADTPGDEQELRAMLRDGRALSAFRAIVEAQGGDPRVCDDPHAVLPARDVRAHDARHAVAVGDRQRVHPHRLRVRDQLLWV